MPLSSEFLGYFEGLEDPRVADRNLQHKLEDIFAITILAVICGADNWVEIVQFAEGREYWLKGFLELPNGIPSHDTFGRVFAMLDARKFERCFSKWAHFLPVLLGGSDKIQKEIIAIDGKTSCASHNKKKGQKPLHMVSAWACDQGLVLGQVSTDVKSNEITAIPQLLNMIAVENSIVTIDAMGCQKDIARQIRDQKADYILNLKDNHPTLSSVVQKAIDKSAATTFKDVPYRRQIEKVKARGRIEKRRYTLMSCNSKLLSKAKWPGLVSVGMVEVKRTIDHITTTQTRYFVTSLEHHKIDDFMRGVRNHWNVEINLHWSLDVSFADDLNRTRTGNAQENLSIIKRIALNLLKQEKTAKIGISAKRKKAAWNNNYLQKIITQ